jgi:calcineurin-like phosphoesterase family protein
MAKRFFTADFHLCSGVLCDPEIMKNAVRPFSSSEEMNAAYLASCNRLAGTDDVIIHVGDLFQRGKDQGQEGSRSGPSSFLRKIKATFVNVRGNHDAANRVKSVCDSMRTRLGKKFVDVSVGHYPTTSPEAEGSFRPGDIHLCGHVHGKWKHMIDYQNSCLNVNVGVDVWGHQIVSEDELIDYIAKVLAKD